MIIRTRRPCQFPFLGLLGKLATLSLYFWMTALTNYPQVCVNFQIFSSTLYPKYEIRAIYTAKKTDVNCRLRITLVLTVRLLTNRLSLPCLHNRILGPLKTNNTRCLVLSLRSDLCILYIVFRAQSPIS